MLILQRNLKMKSLCKVRISTSVAILLISLLFVVTLGCDKYIKITTWESGKGDEIVFYTERVSEVMTHIYYSVNHDNKEVQGTIAWTSVSEHHGEHEYQLISIDNNELIGVVTADDPEEYKIICDFSKQYFWPGNGEAEGLDCYRTTCEERLNRGMNDNQATVTVLWRRRKQ